MKKTLLALCMLTAFSSAQAIELYSNGPAAVGTPPLSVIRLGGGLLGAGAQGSIPNLVADNFTVGGDGWNVEGFNFFAYQSFAGSQFTFSTVAWSIAEGSANGPVVALGNADAVNGGLAGYRVSSTTLANTDRAIFQVNVTTGGNLFLAPGDYWLRWGLTGTLASGPWQPPTADGAIGNAVQSLANAPFVQLIDAGDGLGVELPFTIQGSLVPEPGTYALMLAGGLVMVGVARRRRVQA